MKHVSNYSAPEITRIEIESEKCFATSMHTSSHDGFSSNDNYDDSYWFDNEVEL